MSVASCNEPPVGVQARHACPALVPTATCCGFGEELLAVAWHPRFWWPTLAVAPLAVTVPSGAASPQLRSACGCSRTSQKSKQANIGASWGSFLEPAPRSSRTNPPDVVVRNPRTLRMVGMAGVEGFEPSIFLIQRTPDVSPMVGAIWSVARTRISVGPAGNQVEHAGRSQVDVFLFRVIRGSGRPGC